MLSKSLKKVWETVIPVLRGKNVSKNSNATNVGSIYDFNKKKLPPGSRKNYCYSFNNEEEWNKFSSTRFYGTHLYETGKVHDMNYYPSTAITGFISKEIEKAISKETKNDDVKFLCLEENIDEDAVPFPTIKIECPKTKKEINLKDLLDNDICKKRDVRAITLCNSDKDKTRGIRLFVCEDGTRIYEVANGSYEMALRWHVEGKECKVKVLIHGDKPVELIESNGVTDEQLRAHKEVELGPQCKVKPLYEALAPQLQQAQLKSSEEKIKVLSQESSKIKDLVAKNPETKSVLRELGSQLQQKSPEEQSSVKQEIKYPEKELKQLGGSWGRLLPNMPDPTKWDISDAVGQLGGPSTDLREVKNTLLLKKGLISEKTLNQLG